GTTRLLEAIRMVGLQTRFYQASSSEMFGAAAPPQNEETAFWPRSPYGVAKVYSYWITRNYREAYDMFAVNGILFNHESPRRGQTFVTRKIAVAAARIAAGMQDYLYLGNLEAVRDFVEFCFGHVGLDPDKHVRFDERYLRPAEVDALIGDASKAQSTLGWTA